MTALLTSSSRPWPPLARSSRCTCLPRRRRDGASRCGLLQGFPSYAARQTTESLARGSSACECLAIGDGRGPGRPRALRNFVTGEWVDAPDGRTADLIAPSRGEPFAKAPVSGTADVD